jgi:tRNA (adenine37-N6)-methyltransferase
MPNAVEPLCLTPIGVVHSPFENIEEMPIQPTGAANICGSIELRPDLVTGLQDLEGFSHLWVIYHFHRSGPVRLTVTPFLDHRPHGVFATRAPVRPNPLGLSLVLLLGIEGNRLQIGGVDILDGTPVLDIKPYVPAFDQAPAANSGWLEEAGHLAHQVRADGRFKG